MLHTIFFMKNVRNIPLFMFVESAKQGPSFRVMVVTVFDDLNNSNFWSLPWARMENCRECNVLLEIHMCNSGKHYFPHRFEPVTFGRLYMREKWHVSWICYKKGFFSILSVIIIREHNDSRKDNPIQIQFDTLHQGLKNDKLIATQGKSQTNDSRTGLNCLYKTVRELY